VPISIGYASSHRRISRSGRLRDDARGGPPPPPQSGEHPEAAVLLALDAGQQDVPAQRDARAAQHAHRQQCHSEPALHVAGAPAEDAVARDGTVVGVRVPPGRQVSGGHDVDVGAEHEAGPVAGARQARDDAVRGPARLRAVDLAAGEAGIAGELRHRNGPLVAEVTRG
jgi:hypothetical protein